MLKIWGRLNSSNVKKVIWIANELKLPYEHMNLGGAYGGLDDPAFLQRNPNGLVPLIEDGKTVLWESNVIVRYLAAQYGKDTFWIEDPAKRAQAEKWMDWASTTSMPDFRDVMMNLVRLPEDQRDPIVAQRGVQGLSKMMRIANNALEQQPWLTGDHFGIGDIPLGCLVYAWFLFPIEREDMPALEAWYKRLTERPAYQKAVMIPLS
ncbi:glutathione S-transferase family protein [Daeguia caeni]|uniref:Glutathione S-transferase family protein n=1 Tax=Daeguia caeni TaxID=439612 RepID=A0ABV9H6C3_9HYPH